MKILNDHTGEVDGKVVLTLADCRQIIEALDYLNESGDGELYGKLTALAQALEAAGS